MRGNRRFAAEAKMIGPEEDQQPYCNNGNLPGDPYYLPKDYRKKKALRNSPAIQRLDDYLKISPQDPTAGNWLARSEIPSTNEIMDRDEDWEMAKNGNSGMVTMEGIPAQGAFRERDDGKTKAEFVYLETHFQLLREEAVRPLREAVASIRDSSTLPVEQLSSKLQNTGIYSKVHIRGLTCSQRGIAVEVSFSLRSCRSKVAWENSNRLTSGTLVVLSRDNFKSHCMVATIAARDLEKLSLNPPRIDLYFAENNICELDPCEEFIMVEERTGFFEAQRSAMLALQRLSRENDDGTFPLSNQIVHVQDDAGPAAYIAHDPIIDATKIFGPGFEAYNAMDIPNLKTTTMDETQLSALHHMINSQLAMVQGPPGTGKTYVSVLALKLLLELTKHDDAPVVVACHTNHALDQLLQHIAPDIPEDFARLGARSKDDGIVKQRTMKTLRLGLNRAEKDPCNRGGKLRSQHDRVVKHLQVILGLYTSEMITLNDFSSAGLLTPEQCQSIIFGNSQYLGESRRCGNRRRIATRNQDSNDVDHLHQWLGAELETIPSLDFDDTLGVDYADDEDRWESEVVKERLAEAGIGDDDLDQVRGTYIPLTMKWRGHARSTLSETEARKLLSSHNINENVPLRRRGALFNFLLSKLKQRTLDDVRAVVRKDYKSVSREFQQLSFERDLVILQKQKLIGMTTTGLSKFRCLLDALKPKVIMIEEAAESLEAPLVSACVPSLQHLILVGDHQQLKPTVVVREHAGDPWNFDLSLMERLLNNNLSYKHLGVQRRMAPEISANLFPIYSDKIRDHEDVKDRIPVRGLMDTTWTYSHQFPDNRDYFMSSYNEGEADMVAGFYLYLLQNGIDRDKITILTFYKAQRKLLLGKVQKICVSQRVSSGRPVAYCPEEHLPDVRTVDSYQGEENDVIIISLVRSGGSNGIGFAGSDNRICVAISRARIGFYIFGNMELFASCSSTWSQIAKIMRDKGKVGEEEIRIKCENHDHVSTVRTSQDWEAINGGCMKPCDALLVCGHECPARCHPNGHGYVICQACSAIPEIDSLSIVEKDTSLLADLKLQPKPQTMWATSSVANPDTGEHATHTKNVFTRHSTTATEKSCANIFSCSRRNLKQTGPIRNELATIASPSWAVPPTTGSGGWAEHSWTEWKSILSKEPEHEEGW